MRRSIPEIAAELRRLVATAPSDATLVEDVERDLGADLCEQDRRLARERAAETRRTRKEERDALLARLRTARIAECHATAAKSVAATTGECRFTADLVLVRMVDLKRLRDEHAGLTAAVAALGASAAATKGAAAEAGAQAETRLGLVSEIGGQRDDAEDRATAAESRLASVEASAAAQLDEACSLLESERARVVELERENKQLVSWEIGEPALQKSVDRAEAAFDECESDDPKAKRLRNWLADTIDNFKQALRQRDMARVRAESAEGRVAVLEAAARAVDGAVLIGLGGPREMRGVWMSGDRDHAGIFSALRDALAASPDRGADESAMRTDESGTQGEKRCRDGLRFAECDYSQLGLNSCDDCVDFVGASEPAVPRG